jgi:hypothetical protein
MRQEVTGLTSDINELSRAASSVELSDQKGLIADNEELQKQINLLNQRRNLLQPPTTSQSQREPIIRRISENEGDIRQLEQVRNEYTPDTDDYRQLTDEINRLNQENDTLKARLDRLEEVSEKPSTPLRDSNFYKQRIAENKEDIIELKKTRKTLDLETEEGRSIDSSLENEIKRLEASNIELSNLLKDSRRYEEKEKKSDTKPSVSQDITLLRQLVQLVGGISQMLSEGGRETTDTGRDENRYGPAPIPPIPAPIPSGSRPTSAPRVQPTEEDERSRFQVGTGTTSILMHGAVDAMSRYSLARNEYEGTAGMVGALGNLAGGTIGSIGNAFGPIGGAVGGIVGGLVSGLSSLVVNKWMMELQALEGAERNSLGYSQVSGRSIGQTINQGYREGSFAASDLGMDVSEYMGRRGSLLRAAGGKILGGQEDDTREMNSLMAVTRAYGLSDQTINQLQGSMRFARQGETEYGSSSNSPSTIIRLFENTMKELKLPFSEIAATMDESLDTFNRTVTSVLEKTGSVDTGSIATILANVRASTGFEGRQLERVQSAVSGQRVSQDDVTQALLMRVAREVNPEAGTFTELMSSIEKMSEDPELQRAFLNKIEEMVGNEEQLRNVLKSIFPDLSYSDVVDLTKRRNEIAPEASLGDFLTQGGQRLAPEVSRGNEGEAQYDTSIASRTVGTIEAANAARRNERIGEGGEALEKLTEINSKLEKLLNIDTAVTNIFNFLSNPELQKAGSDIASADLKENNLRGIGAKVTALQATGQLNPYSIYKIIDNLFKAQRR